MKVIFLSILFILISTLSFGQIKQFDNLEVLYAQGHYKNVYRKANRLIDNPEYDFSQIPVFYKSLSMFQLAQDKHWSIRHKDALSEADKLMIEVKKSSDGVKVFTAHQFELASLKKDLAAWAQDLKRQGEQSKFNQVELVLKHIFEDIPDINDDDKGETVDPDDKEKSTPEREKIVALAKKHLGTPYVWAGEEPSGFDCSGFTSYVFKEVGIVLPRRAVDQYNKSTQLKDKNVQKGDLIFFDNGSGISHVGIVISNTGKPIVMIHSSTSKGIVITEIESSEYWKKRIAGYGTYLK